MCNEELIMVYSFIIMQSSILSSAREYYLAHKNIQHTDIAHHYLAVRMCGILC